MKRSGDAVVTAPVRFKAGSGGVPGHYRQLTSDLPEILLDESRCVRQAKTYRERTFRWSTVSVPMESFSMRASRIRKRPMAIAPTAIAPIAAAPRANAPTASARAVLPVSIASVALFVWVIGPFSFHLVSCWDYR